MAGRSTRAGGRNTPVNTINPQQLQQPQCEEAHLQTPPQIPQQGPSPPHTLGRDSNLNNDWEPNDDMLMGDNVQTEENTFHSFQMPHSAHSTSNGTFPTGSARSFDRDAYNNNMNRILRQFWFDWSSHFFSYAVDSLGTMEAQTTVSFYLASMARAHMIFPSPDQTGTSDNQNVDS